VDEYNHIEDTLKKKIIEAYWRCGSNKLGRIRPGHDSAWAVGANGTLKGLIDYPVNGLTNRFVARMISEHENNMRWDTIAELLGRVGIRQLSHLLQRSKALKSVLDDPPPGQFDDVIKLKLNQFYVLRNGIVHDIAQNSGIGANTFHMWVLFFRQFIDAIAAACESSYLKFEQSVMRRKSATL
jgi:hypothetical protein